MNVIGKVVFKDGHEEPLVRYQEHFSGETIAFETESGDYYFESGAEFEPGINGWLPKFAFYKFSYEHYNYIRIDTIESVKIEDVVMCTEVP